MKYKGLATVYAYLIIDGERLYSDVPKRLKNQVKEVLESLGAGDLAVESGKYHQCCCHDTTIINIILI